MLFNYLKVAYRYLTKHKGYTIINVLGLAVGIACCILIMQFVKSEWSFDRFHAKSGRLYRAWLEEHYEGNVFTNIVTPIPLVPVLQQGLPDVQAACRVSGSETAVKYGNTVFNDPVTMVDSNFFELFDFPLREGNINNPFPTPNSLIITEAAAKKYFGTSNPIGKNLEIELSKATLLFTVSGVAKNPPLESSVQFDMLIPFSNAPYVWEERTRTQAWSNVAVESFFLLKEGVDVKEVNAKIATVMNPLVAKTYKPGAYNVRLQPLADIHFNATLPNTVDKPSDPKYSYILATIGILILLIACINFVTLSIGRSVTRALEVGVRKVLGAGRQQLIRQYWGEALLLTLLAFLVGLALALLMQKPFNQLANRELQLQADLFTILFCISLLTIIALVAGSYPALVLSRFKPIDVLKGKVKAAARIGFFRKALIVGQFVASISMIIGTFAVGRQLNYLQSKDLGYNREHVVIVPTNKTRKEGNTLAQRFVTALEKNPDVISHTTSLYSMAEAGWMNLGYMDDQNAFRQFRFNVVDADFVNTMGLHVIAGRNFLKNNPSDSAYVLVNEALVKAYGWKDPIGQHLPGKYEERVIGVVKDFNFESLHTNVKPVLLALRPDGVFKNSSDFSFEFAPEPRVSVRFRGGNLQKHIETLRTTWKSVAGDTDFEYQFLDDALNTAYQQEQRLGSMVRYASLLSIFIACMGLFGLATLVVVRRTKEIGIRKVLGADISTIVTLLSKDFVVLVGIASLIAFPLAWLALNKWLQDFAYRMHISWWLFAAAAFLSLIIAVVTVSVQAMRAALANPVKSLRTE
jgi:putative ABC transport system permease protein